MELFRPDERPDERPDRRPDGPTNEFELTNVRPQETTATTTQAGTANGDASIDESRVSVVWSATQNGQMATPLRIECAQARGFSGITMIGSAGRVCEDGKERARTALERIGWVAPARKILISVSPAEAKIDRSHLDLALCVGLAAVVDQTDWRIDCKDWMFTAEVGLNGELRPVSGVVSWASAAMCHGLKGIVVAKENLQEVNCLVAVSNAHEHSFAIHGFNTVSEVMAWLATGQGAAVGAKETNKLSPDTPNFDDMDLTPQMKLVAMVSAAGMHSLLMRGSPGTGKSMFARRLASLLPTMNSDEHLKALCIHSAVSSQVPPSIIWGIPPYRAPHHFASLAAMVGSATAPGEISLASGGVLFLDELPEFHRDVLEGLREPIETGEVAVCRAGASNVWTAKVLLVAAANNCPCGWGASKRRRCDCQDSRIKAYRNRVSGALQDRIDIHVNMEEPSNQTATLFAHQCLTQNKTTKMRAVVAQARERSQARSVSTGATLNRDIPSVHVLNTFGRTAGESLKMIEQIIPSHASARSLIRCLRVARTIADVENRDAVLKADIERAWGWQAWSAARQRGEILPL
jgi:magnesium chelatase family protein